MYFIKKITSNHVVDFAAEELKKYLRMMMPRCGEIKIDYDPAATDGFRLGLMQDFGLDVSEAKVMEIIWARSPISAKDISLIATESIGWNKNTTYTIIKKLEAKGFIRREDPGFICTPLVSQNEMQKVEVASLVKKENYYD